LGSTGARLEAASHGAPHPRGARGAPQLKDAVRLLTAGKLDEAVQALYQLRQKAPRNPAVALLLGHAYFRKQWRTDGLREYGAALQLRPSLRSDRVLVHNVVSALDDPTSRMARQLISARLGTAALAELRRAARDSRNPKVQKRAGRLALDLAPRRAKRR
jgi:predicted Zn-dependent protease